jgi:tRNA modification GTPase
VAEIHTVGSRPLLEAGLRALCAAGARLAEPGEFTLRAFLAGKMDLPRAEAVLGVIDAADPGDLSIALAQLAGGLSEPLAQLRDRLLDLLAHIEVGFDFADEDLPLISQDALDRQLAAALETVEHLGRRTDSRRASGDLPRVVLVGWPNTGKSSLFNVLAGRPAAIVSEHPGTTRDYLGAELDLHGRKCMLVDTAGIAADRLHEATGPEVAAQAAALEQARRADVRLLCLDSSRPLNAWERGQLAEETGPRVVILTKADAPRRIDLNLSALPGKGDRYLLCEAPEGPFRQKVPVPFSRTSSVTGEGIDQLRERIAEAAAAARWSASAVVPGTAARCQESLRLAAECLVRARNVLQAGLGEELVAAEIRLALDEIGRVAGTVYTEDVLARVFSRFCVGK